MTTYDDFKFSMPLTQEVEAYLKQKGYERRAGTFAYPEDRKSFMVVPFKKWYWEDSYEANIHIQEVATLIPIKSLEVKVRQLA